MWVIGDLFQQYAAKYVGIGRGIPLSNTNQLWGLLWGVFVFGELADAEGAVLARVVTGSLLMAAGALAIALSSAPLREHVHWQAAAEREARRYGLDPAWVQARLAGEDPDAAAAAHRGARSTGLLVAGATAAFVWAASAAEAPALAFRSDAALALTAASVALLAWCGARALAHDPLRLSGGAAFASAKSSMQSAVDEPRGVGARGDDLAVGVFLGAIEIGTARVPLALRDQVAGASFARFTIMFTRPCIAERSGGTSSGSIS